MQCRALHSHSQTEERQYDVRMQQRVVLRTKETTQTQNVRMCDNAIQLKQVQSPWICTMIATRLSECCKTCSLKVIANGWPPSCIGCSLRQSIVSCWFIPSFHSEFRSACYVRKRCLQDRARFANAAWRQQLKQLQFCQLKYEVFKKGSSESSVSQ